MSIDIPAEEALSRFSVDDLCEPDNSSSAHNPDQILRQINTDIENLISIYLLNPEHLNAKVAMENYVHPQNMNKRMEVEHIPTRIFFNICGDRIIVEHTYDAYAFVVRNSAKMAHLTPKQAISRLITTGHIFPKLEIDGFLVYNNYHMAQSCSIRWPGGSIESNRIYNWSLETMAKNHNKGSNPPYIIITNPAGLSYVQKTYENFDLSLINVPRKVSL